jgi:7,8-dihydropterin-6-yl-methyl-4-(beta-D-ribofuranosyl)aminobenzene 5'-phosphate synthase
MWKGIIKIITENSVYNKRMIAEEGLAILVEEFSPEPIKILIDTGRNYATIAHNLHAINEDPKNINAIIATHGHAGHIQSLSDFVKDTNKPKLILNPEIFDKKYKKKLGNILPGGVLLDRSSLLNFSDLIETDRPYQLTEHIWTSGKIHVFEQTELGNSEKDKYWKESGKTLIPDYFDEETAVFIKSNIGIIILTSCGHRGIGNIVETAKKVFVNEQIAAVIGGFHTTDRPEIVPILIERLTFNKVPRVMPCHCTGLKGKISFSVKWKEKFFDISTGSIIKIEDDIVVE